MLQRQKVIQEEIYRISEVAGTRLEAMFELSVDAIGDTLKNGSHADKMKAVRAHGELTKRIGRPDPFAHGNKVTDDRLSTLANRLEHLLDSKKPGLYDETGAPIFEDAEVLRTRTFSGQASPA